MEDLLKNLKNFIEKYSFGVCAYIGEKIGIQASRVRIYFIYVSFAAMGSPILIYLIMAFWLNVKKYLRKSRNLLWD